MPKGFKKSADPYEDLDSDYKDAIVAMSVQDINKRIAEVAKNEEENLRMKSEDQDLQERQKVAAGLSAPYDAKSKEHKLLIRAVTRVLKDKAIASATADDLNGRISTAAKAEEENQKAKADDSALSAAKVDVSDAQQVYKDATKQNRLRIRYAMRVLGDKGGA